MPYNPGIQFRGGEYLAQGIAALGDAIAARQEQKQRLLDNAAVADKFVKLNPELLGQLGMGEEDWGLQSPAQKVAALGAAIQTPAYKKGQQDLLAAAQLIKLHAAQTAAETGAEQRAQAAAAEDTALGRALAQSQVGGPKFTPDLASGLAAAGLSEPAAPTLDPELAGVLGNPNLGGKAKLETLARYADTRRALAEAARYAQPPKLISGQLLPALDASGQRVPDTWVNPNSGAVVQTTKPKETAPNLPWAYSDDQQLFASNLMKLAPAVRDLVLELRSNYNRAMGKNDPLANAIKEIVGNKPTGAVAAPAAARAGVYDLQKGGVVWGE